MKLILRRLFAVMALSCAALVTPVAASAVNEFEWNYTTNGDEDGYLNCTSVAGGQPGDGIAGCFHPVGDKFWVSDYQRDGLSAALYWSNYNSDGTVYRHGACVENRGADSNGWCNKNFREGTDIRFRLCFLDVPTGVRGDCGPLTRYIES